MINARKILRNVRTMTQQERIGLHSGRNSYKYKGNEPGNPVNIFNQKNHIYHICEKQEKGR